MVYNEEKEREGKKEKRLVISKRERERERSVIICHRERETERRRDR